MFYDNFVGQNKTLLNIIWYSAHFWDEKVKKMAITHSKIDEYIALIQSPNSSFNYRMRSCLIFGVVRIFARKTDYLLIECKNLYMGVCSFQKKDDCKLNVRPKKGTKRVRNPTTVVSDDQEIVQIVSNQFIDRVTAPRNISLSDNNVRGLPYFDSPIPEESVPSIRVQDETHDGFSRANSLLEDHELEMPYLPLVPIPEEFSYERSLLEDSLLSPRLEELQHEVSQNLSPQLSAIEVPEQVQPQPQPEVFARPNLRVVREPRFRKRRKVINRRVHLQKQTYRVSSEDIYEYEHEIGKSSQLLPILNSSLLCTYNDIGTSTIDMEEVESEAEIRNEAEIEEDVEIKVIEDIREQSSLPFGATDKNISETESISNIRQYLTDITNQPTGTSEVENHLLRAEVTSAFDRNMLNMEANEQHMVSTEPLFPETSLQIPESIQAPSTVERTSTSRASKRPHSESPENRKRCRFFDDYKKLQHQKCEEKSKEFFNNEIKQQLNVSGCKTIIFNEILGNKKRDQVARGFLSLLYLQKNHKIILKQDQCFENIYISVEEE